MREECPDLLAYILINAAANVGEPLILPPTEYLSLPNVVTEFIRLYTETRKDLMNLTAIANALNNYRKSGQEALNLQITIPATSFVIKNNKFTWGTESPLEKVITEGIEKDRLRICEICGRIFWAKRTESETCSPECANNLRVRLSRSLSDEQKAERNAERKANRLQNKKLKELKKGGKMALYRRGKTWWMNFWFDGIHVQKSTKCKNKRDAETIERAYQTQLAKGEVGIEPKREVPTFKQAVKDFLAFLKVEHTNKPNTFRRYENDANVLLRFFGDVQMNKITVDTVEKFKIWRSNQKGEKTKRKLEPATINHEIYF